MNKQEAEWAAKAAGYVCYYCRKPIPADIVEACRSNRVPVRCECRPGAIGVSNDFDGRTIPVKNGKDKP